MSLAPRAAETADAIPHSITRSVRASSDGDIISGASVVLVDAAAAVEVGAP